MQKTNPPLRTIQQVLDEFANERGRSLDPSEHYAYRRVLFFLELCINNYGHRNLDEPDRARFEERCRAGDDVCFFEVFGPRMLLPELHFFVQRYVRCDVFTTERIERMASEVVEDLKAWMVDRGYVGEDDLDAASATVRERARLEKLARRAARLLASRAVLVEPSFFAGADYLEVSDVPITRVSPGRIWLRIYARARAEVVGPLAASVAATESLRAGFCLNGSLARIRGQWHLAGVESVYPRVSLLAVCKGRARG